MLHRPKKSPEHTEPGGALALAGGDEGQLAGEQEVLGLIGQRETPLGRRSQLSVGTSLAHRPAWGALMETDDQEIEVTDKSPFVPQRLKNNFSPLSAVSTCQCDTELKSSKDSCCRVSQTQHDEARPHCREEEQPSDQKRCS
ncbi:hypothetical protein KUCAC02_004443 [Chaenocephalus aceratus]|uniref:Uncharacterized protein n=1 Tax=Chaenocephalus aceratus TaxID=36190 RepID=A0ACB9X0E5_CHAAC|nr:hypothetical protein KUCAC02_004443 [Chaenocephalus aceratus]